MNPPHPVTSSQAPAAVGPYSQAVVVGNLVFCSGQVALDPGTMQIVPGGIDEQTHRVISNLEAVLRAAGVSLRDVVRTTVFLTDMNDFAAMNAVYAERFGAHRPSRSTVEVSRLPKDARVEIDCIAAKS